MAERNPASVFQNRADHPADLMRKALEAGGRRAEGVIGASDLAVTQRGAGANMSVDVATGTAVVDGDEALAQGGYVCFNDATVNLAITASDATKNRNDLIVARVRDQAYSGSQNLWALEVVPGALQVGAGVDPTVPVNAVTLGRVAVTAALASVTNAAITDLRPSYFGGSGVAAVNSARRPGDLYGPLSKESTGFSVPAPWDGMPIFETDTRLLKFYKSSDATWRQPDTSTLGYASRAAGSDGNTYTRSSATFADLDAANFSVTFNAPRSGVVCVEFECLCSMDADATAMFTCIRESTTNIGSIRMQDSAVSTRVIGKLFVSGLTAGSAHTYKWGWRSNGANTAQIQTGPTWGPATMRVLRVDT